MYKLICMSFDGDHITERPEFESIEDAWEYSNDLGSKWYFYPFHFVVTGSGLTVADPPHLLEFLKGRRVKTVARLFAQHAQDPEMLNADCEAFAFTLPVPE